MDHEVREEAMRLTLEHVRAVGTQLMTVCEELQRRAIHHDQSKFSSMEFATFAEETHTLKGLTYGSDEYKDALDRMRPALEHHYYTNRHHPEYWAMDDSGRLWYDQVKDGSAIRRMNLIDLIEMLADWKAATERHEDGDLRKSIEINAARFGYGEHMKHLLLSTAEYLGWFKAKTGEAGEGGD